MNKVSARTPKGKEDSTDSSSEDGSEDEKVCSFLLSFWNELQLVNKLYLCMV